MNYRPCDPGPQVSIANLQEGQRFRGGIVVQAGIRSLNGVRVVQYEVDGQAVGEDTTQPFEQSVTFTDSVETPHTICVRAVDQLDVEDRVCINVIWEPGPTVTPSPTPGPVVVTITAPDKGSGIVDIGFDVTPPDRVARIQWLVDNTVQGEGAWPELKKVRWDTKGLAPGQYTIGVKVLDARGNELGRQQKEFTIPSPPGGPDIGLLIIAALVLAAGLMGVLLVRRRRRARPEFVEEEVVYGGQDAMGTADIADGIMTKDVSDEAAALGPIARLRIKRSLELSSTETFDLYARSSRIGRGSDNDIPIPDAPVSRQHAELRYEDDRFRIYDLNSTYGTRVNGTRVPPEGADLKDGDEVQLGTRTVLVFEQIVKPEPSKGDETKDIGGGEETRDIGGGEETRDIGDTAGTQPFHP
jgi:pSer/pThr/pTyr-binding forkhead associated (FHA) protein